MQQADADVREAEARLREGARLIVIDPRRSETAAMADFHLAVRPGTDAWCLAALAAIIVQDGFVARAWLDEQEGNPSGARAAYQRIVIDAPRSPAAARARAIDRAPESPAGPRGSRGLPACLGPGAVAQGRRGPA